MTLIINLPEDLEKRLKQEATAHDTSIEEFALGLLENALEPDLSPTWEEREASPTLEQVVANIRALPPNPNSIRPATGSLAEALRDAPVDPAFDLEQWTMDWQRVETEMDQATKADDSAEGRD